MCPSFRIFLPELLIYVSIYYSADAAKWRDLDPRVLRYSRSEEQRSDERHKQLSASGTTRAQNSPGLCAPYRLSYLKAARS